MCARLGSPFEQMGGTPVTGYVFRKIGQALVVILLVTFLSFLLINIIPGDAVALMLGVDATPEKAAELRAELYLDRPFIEQYARGLWDVVRGDLGTSISYHLPVTQVLGPRMTASFQMGLAALILSTLLGLIMGCVAAVNRGRAADNLISVLANIGISMPSFWLGIVMIYLFAMNLKWLPVQGYTPFGENPALHMRQMIMPVIVTAMGGMASLARQTRSSILETISLDFVRTARSKGLREKSILIRHVMRNALIPILTLLGMQIRVLFGGVVLVENIFNVPGMGNLLVSSVNNRDIPMVQACVLVMAVVVVIANLLVDIAYGVVDPRIRQERGHNA